MNYREAFVYKWTHTTGMWYVGYHKGTIDDGYICSSKVVKPMIVANPDQWTREIIAHGTKQAMIDLEIELLVEVDAKRNPMSYNKHNRNGHCLTGRKKGSTNKLNRSAIFEAIKRLTGKSWIEHLAEDYVDALRSRDRKLINSYNKLLKKHFNLVA